MLQSDRYWADLARAIGHPELATDERFEDGGARLCNAELAIAILDEAFATRTRDEWVAHLSESEGDFIFTIVNSVDELTEDPQVLANDYVVDFDHPQHGRTRVANVWSRMAMAASRLWARWWPSLKRSSVASSGRPIARQRSAQ